MCFALDPLGAPWRPQHAPPVILSMHFVYGLAACICYLIVVKIFSHETLNLSTELIKDQKVDLTIRDSTQRRTTEGAIITETDNHLQDCKGNEPVG